MMRETLKKQREKPVFPVAAAAPRPMHRSMACRGVARAPAVSRQDGRA
jgi:hypothetical protein